MTVCTMHLPQALGLFSSLFLLFSTSLAIPATNPFPKHGADHSANQHSPLLSISSPSVLSRRDGGFVDHNDVWRTHFLSVSLGTPNAAAASTCYKILNFIIKAYVPRFLNNPSKNFLPIRTGDFEIAFASTQAIDWETLKEYAEALIASPIANELAGLWQVSLTIDV